MEKKFLNKHLHSAKTTKQDEFYTQLSDIEKELKHYQKHFKGKSVLCNCDDPWVSNFFKYFANNFEKLGLKKVITTCYKNQKFDLFSEHKSEQAVYLEYNGDKNNNRVPDPEEIGVKPFKKDGDFRSKECIELLKQADIVVTNPPFSLFREYVSQLIEYDKKFLIIGNQNAVSYKEIFTLIKENKIWLGYMHPVNFIVPDHYEMREVRSWRDENGTNWRSMGNACWFTNLDIKKRHEDIELYKKYNKKEFPAYDNYHAIEVSKFADIPMDFKGTMGVPITFLDKYNPEQFEIIGFDYEVRQQRTISLCQYVQGDYSINGLAFHNLKDDQQEQILNYRLMIYTCSGKDSEKLEWFRTINIAGEKLTDQELRNAVYAGSWVSDAKKYFSKTNCVAFKIGSDYLNGSPIRQEYLETAIDWISDGNIEDYMSKHQHDPIAIDLKNYFQSVISWVEAIFTTKRKFMKGVEWGKLYNEFKDKKYGPKKIEAETAKLIADDDVVKKNGIYPYILTRDEKYLSIRAFSDSMKQKVFEKQKGICPHCKKEKKEKIEWELEEMEGDHITPWRDGGHTTEDNCQMLCKDHNRRKSGK